MRRCGKHSRWKRYIYVCMREIVLALRDEAFCKRWTFGKFSAWTTYICICKNQNYLCHDRKSTFICYHRNVSFMKFDIFFSIHFTVFTNICNSNLASLVSQNAIVLFFQIFSTLHIIFLKFSDLCLINYLLQFFLCL